MSVKLDFNLINTLIKTLDENQLIDGLTLQTKSKDNFIIRLLKSLVYPVYDFYKTFRSKYVITRLHEAYRQITNFDEDTALALKEFILKFNDKTHKRHDADLMQLIHDLDRRCKPVEKEFPPYSKPELKTAMMLFKNEHPDLSSPPEGPLPFSNFLGQLLAGLPAKGPELLKEILLSCFENQKELEKLTCDLSIIQQQVKSWIDSPDASPSPCFYFPGVIPLRNALHFAIIRLEKNDLLLKMTFTSAYGQLETDVSTEAFLDVLPQYLNQINQYCLAYRKAPEMAQASYRAFVESTSKFLYSPIDLEERVLPGTQKILSVFFKAFSPDQFKVFKEIEKMKALLAALKAEPQWDRSPNWRHWAKQCLMQLQQTLPSIPAAMREEYDALKQQVEFLNHKIVEAEKRRDSRIIPNPLQATLPDQFICSPAWSDRISFPGIEPLKEERLFEQLSVPSVARPNSYPDYSCNKREKMNEWLIYFNHLKKQKDFSKLDFEATHLLLNLPPAGLLLKLEDLDLWIEYLFQSVNLLIHAHYALNRLTLHPSRTLALLKAIEICIKLYNPESGLINNFFVLDAEESIDLAFEDLYHSLSFYGGEIIGTWNEIKSITKQFKSSSPSKFQHWPTPLKRTYHLFKLVQIALHPQSGIFASSVKEANKLGKYSSKNHAEVDALYQEFIQEFQLGRVQLQEGASLEFRDNDPDILDPFGLVIKSSYVNRFINRQENVKAYHQPRTPYFSQAHRIVNADRRSRIAEGLISRWTHAGMADGFHNSFEISGSVLTQREALEEKFKFDHTPLVTSQDLMLMQSSPVASRVSNTFYVFSKYPHLFSHQDWRQIFRLNLFRNGGLYKEINKNPKQAFPMLMKLEEMLSFVDKTRDEKSYLFLIQCCAEVLSVALSSNLPSAHKDKLQRTYAVYFEKVKGLAEASQREPEKYPHAYDYHKTLLLYHAYMPQKPLSTEDKLALAKSYFLIGDTIDKTLSELDKATLADFMRMLNLDLLKLVKSNRKHLDTIISYRYPAPKSLREWRQEGEEGIWTCGPITVNLELGKAITPMERESYLPPDLRKNPKLIALFGEKKLNKKHQQAKVKTELGEAWCVQLHKNALDYVLYYRQGDAHFPILFRKKEEWEQLLHLVENSPTALPQDFKDGFFWQSHKHSMTTAEDHVGRATYSFEIQSPTISLKHQSYPVLNPWNYTEYDLFKTLDHPSGIRMTCQGETVHCQYLHAPLSYIWNGKESRWDCLTFAYYYLSSNDIEHWFQPSVSYDVHSEHIPRLFRTDFKRYQIIENQQGNGRLLLFYQKYQKTPRLPNYQGEFKYSNLLIPIRSEQTLEIAIFELEKFQDLKTKNPQDYLYLAYLLFTQGKYESSLAYLQKSQLIWPIYEKRENALLEKVQAWFLEWEDHTPSGKALKLHLYLQIFLQKDLKAHTCRQLEEDLHLLQPLSELASFYQNEFEKLPPILRLNAMQREDLRFILARNQENLSPFEALNKALDEEIEYHKSKLQAPLPFQKSEPIDYTPQMLVDILPWLITSGENQHEMQQKIDLLTAEMLEIFKADETLAGQMARELADDFQEYAKKVHSTPLLNKEADLPNLSERLQGRLHVFEKSELKLKQHLLAQFQTLPKSKTETVLEQLKERERSDLENLEKAKYCFATGDWSPLISKQILMPEQINSFSQLFRNYLITRTNRKLLARKIQALQNFIANREDSVLHFTTSQSLQEWRQYDADHHPWAHLLLIIEDERNVNLRQNQIEHILKIVQEENVFVHEAMAGGKTSLLRNIFCAIQATHHKLPGVMTYGPLMKMHHRDFAYVNEEVFGAQAFPLEFSRDQPRDSTALKILLLQHLKAVNRKGRIDQTPRAILSIKHALTELVENIHPEESEQQKEIRSMIDVLQELEQFRKSRMALYSDEMDKNCDPQKFYNYSHGEPTVLLEKFYAPALKLMTLLMKQPSLKKLLEAIQSNRLKQLTEDEFEELLASLAKEVCNELKMTDSALDVTQTIAYLTEVHQNDPIKQSQVVEYYHRILCYSPIVEELQIFHSYIGILFRGMRQKECGVNYGRSSDGLHVKPYSFSAQPQESSQRSFVLSTVMETCFDYLVNKTNARQMGLYIQKKREAAEAELQQDPALKSIDSTPTAGFIMQNFNLTLSQIDKKKFQEISRKMNANSELMADFLKTMIFSEYTYYENKIEGNAQHFENEMLEFSGASGSPERVRTLPPFIKKLSPLIRQKGAIGSVFYSLLYGYTEQDVHFLDPSRTIESQVSNHLDSGDLFIDNVPYFKGQTGQTIVKKIADPSKEIPYRFLDEQDRVCTYDKETTRLGELGLDYRSIISVIPHQGIQGTDWQFAPNTKGVMGTSVDSDLTTILQAMLRMRLLGKRGQKAIFLADPAIHKIWAQEPKLKNKSVLARLVWLWIHNDVKKIQALNYQSNIQSLKAVANCTIDTIFRRVKNPSELALIKSLPLVQSKSISHSSLAPTQLGAPVQIDLTVHVLQQMQAKERAHLEALKATVAALEISAKEECLDIIEHGIKKLSQEAYILEEKFLPTHASSTLSLDSTEEVEIAVDEIQEQEQQQMTDQQSEVELHLDIDQEQDIEEILKKKRPQISYIGMEMDWNIWGSPPVDYVLKGEVMPIEQFRPSCFLLDQALFPFLYTHCYTVDFVPVSEDSLRVPYVNHPTKDRIAEAIWLYGKTIKQATFSPKILIGTFNDHLFSFMATIATADSSFDAQIQENKTKGLKLYNLDLREPSLPKLKNAQLNEQLANMRLHAKILYVDVQLTLDEKTRLKTWVEKSGHSPVELVKRLTLYLERYYPNRKDTNDLLNVFKSMV
jgi:hypothetical protein